MLTCGYIGSSFPGGRTSKVGFYDLWQRSYSDEVTRYVLHLLGFSELVSTIDPGNRHAMYELYKGLPALDMRSSDVALRQAHALFSKSDDLLSPIDKESVALDAFEQSERDCKVMNEKLDDVSFRSRKDVAIILHYAQSYCASVLGDCPALSDLECAFGPGASASSKKMNTTARWKLSSDLTISNTALSKFEELRECYPAWLGSENYSLCERSRPIPVLGSLVFVPKSFKTYRSVIIEPLLNTFVQKGFGRHIRDRLRMYGIDLRDQSVQRERAREGSVTGRWSTLDLSRASDSIAINLVRELVPWDWYDAFTTWRTPMVSYKRKVFMLEKISSMGNGFTFELETLIFKALIRGIAYYCSLEDDSSVYGDDITCNAQLARAVSHYFPLFGFSVNEDKSFVDGPFREACGGDYLLGVDVRPFYLRGVRDKGRWSLAKTVSFHNFLQRKPWFDPSGKIRAFMLSLIPEKGRKWGPDGYGDIWLLSLAPCKTYLPFAHKHARYRGWEGFIAEGFVAVPARDTTDLPGDALLPSYLAGTGPSDDVYAVRHPNGGRLYARLRKILVTEGRQDAVAAEEPPLHYLEVDWLDPDLS